jgi:hypothetical protein
LEQPKERGSFRPRHGGISRLRLACLFLFQLPACTSKFTTIECWNARAASHVPKRETTNVHNSGQMCMFQGKNGRDFRAFTTKCTVSGGYAKTPIRTNLSKDEAKRRSICDAIKDHRDSIFEIEPAS